MRNTLLSVTALIAMAVAAGTADARPRHWVRSYYRPAYSSYYSYSPGYVYPASYYSSPGYYSGYYGGYYRPGGLSLSWSPGFGLNIGYGTGGYYGYPWYGGYGGYRGWGRRW